MQNQNVSSQYLNLQMPFTLVARGFQVPDVAAGLVDTFICVSLRSTQLQVISLSALKKWGLWSLDIKNPFFADGSLS